MRNFIRYNFGALLWAALILVLLFIPLTGIEGKGFSALDKLIHATIFGMLCYMTIIGQIKQHRFSQKKYKIAKYCLVFTILYGIGTEVAQFGLGYRSFDLFDILANTVGAFAGFAYFQFWISKCLKSAYNFNL